jgi:hypothetical protein
MRKMLKDFRLWVLFCLLCDLHNKLYNKNPAPVNKEAGPNSLWGAPAKAYALATDIILYFFLKVKVYPLFKHQRDEKSDDDEDNDYFIEDFFLVLI